MGILLSILALLNFIIHNEILLMYLFELEEVYIVYASDDTIGILMCQTIISPIL